MILILDNWTMKLESFHWLSHHEPSYPMLHGKRTRNVLGLFYLTFLSFEGVFNKTIIPLELVGYEMTIANSALRAFLTIYHLVSNAP